MKFYVIKLPKFISRIIVFFKRILKKEKKA